MPGYNVASSSLEDFKVNYQLFNVAYHPVFVYNIKQLGKEDLGSSYSEEHDALEYG